MARSIAEDTKSFSVFFLNKLGYLSQENISGSGSIRWARGDWENNINFNISIEETKNGSRENSYVELIYTVSDRLSGEKADMQYKVPLITTPCHYGGKRYWFECSLYKNGLYCGRRVGVLFSIGKWFGCRHCGEIAYNSQMSGGKFRCSSVCQSDIEKAEEEVKRYYYNGKPTRKYRRVIRLNEKLDQSFMLMAAQTDKRFGMLAGLKKK